MSADGTILQRADEIFRRVTIWFAPILATAPRREYGRISTVEPREFGIVAREQLMALVPGWAAATSDNALELQVSRLRAKIEPDPSSPQFVVTEPWIGYRFIAEPPPNSPEHEAFSRERRHSGGENRYVSDRASSV